MYGFTVDRIDATAKSYQVNSNAAFWFVSGHEAGKAAISFSVASQSSNLFPTMKFSLAKTHTALRGVMHVEG